MQIRTPNARLTSTSSRWTRFAEVKLPIESTRSRSRQCASSRAARSSYRSRWTVPAAAAAVVCTVNRRTTPVTTVVCLTVPEPIAS